MAQKNTKGFGLVALFALLVVIGIITAAFLAVTKNKDTSKTAETPSTSNSAQKQQVSSKQFSIFNLGITSLSQNQVSAQALRDYSASEHKGFYIFGEKLPGTPVRLNPNFEFASMKEDAKIISAIDGEVGFIRQQQDSSDYEVFLMPTEDSEWVIGYDHVTNLKVAKGDKVKVGDEIGTPAKQNNGLYRFEFQVNKKQNGSDDIHMCPASLLDDTVKDSWLQQLQQHQEAWEAQSGLELYDTTKQSPVGCMHKELTPKEAQGI